MIIVIEVPKDSDERAVFAFRRNICGFRYATMVPAATIRDVTRACRRYREISAARIAVALHNVIIVMIFRSD
jgi:hypothetical protein